MDTKVKKFKGWFASNLFLEDIGEKLNAQVLSKISITITKTGTNGS
jgi:hypothetical protein